MFWVITSRWVCLHKRGLDGGGALDAVLAAAPGGEEVSRRRPVLPAHVSHHRAAVGGSPGEGARAVETPPHQEARDDQEQQAAGQPDARHVLPAAPVVRLAALTQSAEHFALLPHRIGGLTRHAQEVCGQGEQVGQVRAGLTDGDALFVFEAFALVAHDQAVPVGVVHDAVEGVPADGGRRPAHPD